MLSDTAKSILDTLPATLAAQTALPGEMHRFFAMQRLAERYGAGEIPQEVRDLVSYAKYYPVGNRGVMWGRDAIWGEADYASKGLAPYFETCNSETLLIPQCETAGCLAGIEEITHIDGVDGIFIGPFDLSVALNKPGEFGTQEFKDAIDRILKACKDAGKFAMLYTGDAKSTRAYFEQGFDAAAVSLDTKFYINAFRSLIKDVREG